MVVHHATPVLAVATAVFATWRVLLWRRQRRDLVREAGIWALFIWALIVVAVTFFPMIIIFYDWTSGLNLIPLASIRQLLFETPPGVALENIGGNLLLFFPFGLLMPLLFGTVGSAWGVTWRAAVVSTSVELLQWVTGARATDVDDIILNTTGALVGWLAYRLLVAVVSGTAVGARALDRLASSTEREPLSLGVTPIVISLLVAIPFLVSPVVRATFEDGENGILAHAVAQHPGSSVLARGDFDEHTFVVVGTRSEDPELTLVGFEQVILGRYTWVSTSDPMIGNSSRYAWMVTAFNPERDESPLLVVWGRNEAGASRFDVVTGTEEHTVPIDEGVFVAALPIAPDDIGASAFIPRAPDGTDLTNEFAEF